MEDRAAKLALARKKLKDHQEKKQVSGQKDDIIYKSEGFVNNDNDNSMHSVFKHDEGFVIQSTPDALDSQHSDGFEINKTTNVTSPVSNISHIKNVDATEDNSIQEADVNITEILISNKRNLELQVHHLQTKLGQLEQQYALVVSDYTKCNQKVNELEFEIKNINDKYLIVTEEINIKDSKLNELNAKNTTLLEDNGNLTEQLEFTKSVLNAKEAENDSLRNQLFNLQNQYDLLHLQLQQLTDGTPASIPTAKANNNDKTEAMLQKISNLEQQLQSLQKERDQINLHYEHYVAELNEQLRSVIKKNEELTREVDNLSNRENSLIEQISDMEIRIQNFNHDKKKFEVDRNTSTVKDMQDDLRKARDDLEQLQIKHKELQNQYDESVARVKELSEVKEAECNHDSISLSKLNADMTSDKVAAQRATEQNKKLKQDVQGLEDAFVKMTKDKLELTEKISAEKYLNRELTIKLSEVEEKAKEMQIKLKAKDEEMMRLQSNYRAIEKQCEELINQGRNGSVDPDVVDSNTEIDNGVEIEPDKHSEHECKPLMEEDGDKGHSLQRADAMMKLQDRFLKIMGEVADLSDEKHRLEHIILQLQNETDTICEYVALYQQQRSLLKRRDEERGAQLKIFQQECGKLKRELEELAGLLARFAEDKELSLYFENESKRMDMEKVMTLLCNLKNNSLIDTNKKNIEFKNFYPCNCCSGKLIDV
ncbi:hypothetical protein PYW07_001002 [Mythimna separata]|uniref:Golgin subfamily A conserved domain-containing protein n=1 Tax=Mythimna separata TaxID=271217 RepID=A0AAD7YSQ2_MYTSE|nr:hypothetical protein PYW07_001002 [Mythimna separata]